MTARTFTYRPGQKLTGLIFLRRITDIWVGGVSRRNFKLLSDICGESTLKNVALVVNMRKENQTPKEFAKLEKELPLFAGSSTEKTFD